MTRAPMRPRSPPHQLFEILQNVDGSHKGNWWTWSGSNRRPPRQSRGALKLASSTFLLIPESNDVISSSLAVARDDVHGLVYRTALDRPKPKVPFRALKSSARAGVRPGEQKDPPRSLCKTSACSDFAECRRQSQGQLVDLVGIEPTTSSMPWKRAPSCATGPLLENPIHQDRQKD
jgi:hypothetical protein